MATANKGFGLEIQGARQLRTAFKRAAGAMNDLTGVHREIAKPVADVARKTVPISDPKRAARPGSGSLRKTIRVGATRRAGEVKAGNTTAGKRGKGVVYAAIQEYGNPHRNVPAQRYMQRAVYASRDMTARRYKAAMDRILRKNGLDPE